MSKNLAQKEFAFCHERSVTDQTGADAFGDLAQPGATDSPITISKPLGATTPRRRGR